MRAVVQRVRRARVTAVAEGTGDQEVVGEIGRGLLVLLCAVEGDGADDAAFIERKLLSLRVFADEEGRMNKSVVDVGGALLVVSQFTLAANIGKGARPSFMAAMAPQAAKALLDEMVVRLAATIPVATGRFGATMEVDLTNDGPVTIWLDSKSRGEPR
jgi:D-aminoacyl-tRNA deacylase